MAIGYLNLIGKRLGIHRMVGYKTLENAYGDYDVMAILNDVFFLTQQLVANLEHEFGIDDTCFSNTIKANWESTKDEMLGLSGKGGRGSSKNRRSGWFDKVMIAAGTTFKVISSFAVTSAPTANESPYLSQASARANSGAVRAGAAHDRRRSVHLKGELLGHSFSGSPSQDIPQEGHIALGPDAWMEMLEEVVFDTQTWLEKCHRRSIVETVNSTLKGTMPSPVRKKLIVRKATEIAGRICINIQHQTACIPEVHQG